jgi:hypothetical protein
VFGVGLSNSFWLIAKGNLEKSGFRAHFGVSKTLLNPSRKVETALCFLDTGRQIIASRFRIIALMKKEAVPAG